MNTHSARDRGCCRSHFPRTCTNAEVADCCNSATSNRKSSRSSFADSRRSFATSDIDTAPPRPFVTTCLDNSRNSRNDSETRIDKVCCWGLRGVVDMVYFLQMFQAKMNSAVDGD